jgi:Mg-chelatase subunit ChlD
MTNPNKTSITVILDKSGSMESARSDTIGGYNTFIEDQKKLPGEAEISLIQFNNTSKFTYKSVDVKSLERGLLLEDYKPAGGTALLDAVGKAIIEKGAEFSNLKEEDRPGKVIFVIITDGEENSSSEFTKSKIKELIEQQKNVYSWDFVFLGANINTDETASDLGINLSKALSFSSTKSGGARRAFAAVNSYATEYRASRVSNAAATSFTQEDRDNNS